ncbi:hypothetical protein [Parasphingorhabdus sp.]|uniref:hypothetical protein n=1 Tax=Parasphingorhabdus sp. TaxID=2709688 RepID=UPI00387E4BF8
MRGKKRCRLHGGKSPGAPKGNKNALRHGLYSRDVQDRIKAIEELLGQGAEVLSIAE